MLKKLVIAGLTVGLTTLAMAQSSGGMPANDTVQMNPAPEAAPVKAKHKKHTHARKHAHKKHRKHSADTMQ